MGGGGGGQTCPAQAPWFTGNPDYEQTPIGAPLRGNIACVDEGPLSRRPTAGRGDQDAVNIYGPMEAGFTSQQWTCLGDRTIPGGIDTLLAENMLHHACQDSSLEILDYCGGHATPYHYHEHIDCLYDPDPDTDHSTRVGTALDGRGLYGKNIQGGVPPTDLDVCGGRFGVTPDSNGEEVYYYVMTDEAPFTAGCFGPVQTVEECRALYPATCEGERYTATTEWGTGEYDLDCPCFDEFGSNIPGQGRPGFLAPLEKGAAVASAYAHVNEANSSAGKGGNSTAAWFVGLGLIFVGMAFIVSSKRNYFAWRFKYASVPTGEDAAPSEQMDEL